MKKKYVAKVEGETATISAVPVPKISDFIADIKITDFDTELRSPESQAIYVQGFQDCKDYILSQLKNKGL